MGEWEGMNDKERSGRDSKYTLTPLPSFQLFILPGFRNCLSTIVHIVPTVVTKQIISILSSMSDEARYVTANKIKYAMSRSIYFR